MDKRQLEDAIKDADKVKILVGDHKGLISYVTWYDDEFVNVTPLVFDPLDSLLFKHDEIELV